MFEFQKLLGSNRRGIALQTKLGTDIPNQLGAELTAVAARRDELLVKRCGNQWQRRRPACGEYNCAGHVWACRRTGIFEPQAWTKILADDGYRMTKHPQPDDLAVYFDQNNEILHVGRIVELKSIAIGSSPVPWVVSKWAIDTGEFVHNVNHHPYHDPALGFQVRIDYWTDRPKDTCHDS